MTAKSRRHKLEKKRKSDEHPQPRRREEAVGRKEGTRGRTGLIPRKREGEDASDEGPEQAHREIRKARILYATLTSDESIEGVDLLRKDPLALGWLEKASDKAFEEQGVYPLNEIKPWDYGFYGVPEHFRFYLNDSEKELLDKAWEEFKERHPGYEKAVRATGSSDSASAEG